jgi:hypothetical protein
VIKHGYGTGKRSTEIFPFLFALVWHVYICLRQEYYCVAQTGLILSILLPQLPKDWDYTPAPSQLTEIFLKVNFLEIQVDFCCSINGLLLNPFLAKFVYYFNKI